MTRAGDTPVPAPTRTRATRPAAETARAPEVRALIAAVLPRDADRAARPRNGTGVGGLVPRPPRDGTGVAVLVPYRWTDPP